VVPDPRAKSLPAPDGAARVRFRAGGRDLEVAVRLAGEQPVGLTGGLTLEGDCAILGLAAQPRVVHGKVMDAAGKTLAEHPLPAH
jgi:hypothetical protein